MMLSRASACGQNSRVIDKYVCLCMLSSETLEPTNYSTSMIQQCPLLLLYAFHHVAPYTWQTGKKHKHLE